MATLTEAIEQYPAGQQLTLRHVWSIATPRAASEVLQSVRPVGLLLPAIGVAGAAAFVRAGLGVGLTTIWVGLLAATVMVVPGLVALRVFGWHRGLNDWELLPRAFALSTLQALLVGTVILSVRASIGWGIALLFALTLDGVIWLTLRHPQPDISSGPRDVRRLEVFVIVALWTVFAAVASLAGAPITGEEQVELVTIRKLAESLTPDWTSIMHRPDMVTTYLLTPQYVMVAIIDRLSGAELVGVYSKLRFIYVLLAGASIFALARAVLGSMRGAFLASLIAAIWLVVDPDPFGLMASLFPLARRGAIAAGLLLPATTVFALDAVRIGGWGRVVAVSALAAALLMTHATEGAQLFVLLIAGVAVGMFSLRVDRTLLRRTAPLLVSSAVVVGLFRAIHGQVAQHILEYEAPRQQALAASLAELWRTPLLALGGPMEESGHYIFGAAMPVLPYPVVALVLGAAVVSTRRAPLVAWLWTSLACMLLIFIIPAVALLARVVTTSELYFIFGVATMLSLPVLAAVTDTSVSAVYRFGRCKLSTRAWLISTSAACGLIALWVLPPVVSAAGTAPWLLVGIIGATLVAAAVARLLWRSAADAEPAPLLAFVAVVLIAFAPLAVVVKQMPAGLSGSDRANLLTEAMEAWSRPDPLDFEPFYKSLNPALPWDVVMWLRRTLPPQRVLLYRPDQIYQLAVYLDQYVAHPGFKLSSDAEYFDTWVPDSGGDPLFTAPPDAERDGRFLQAFRVDYILVDPGHAVLLGTRLAEDPAEFQVKSSYAGYALYAVSPPVGGLAQVPVPPLGSNAAAAAKLAQLQIAPAQVEFWPDSEQPDGIARDPSGEPLYVTNVGPRTERAMYQALEAIGYSGPQGVSWKLAAFNSVFTPESPTPGPGDSPGT